MTAGLDALNAAVYQTRFLRSDGSKAGHVQALAVHARALRELHEYRETQAHRLHGDRHNPTPHTREDDLAQWFVGEMRARGWRPTKREWRQFRHYVTTGETIE